MEAGTLISKPVSLFGDAMTSSIPSDFRDASDFRPVPDSQEVFVCMANNDASIIVDINCSVEAGSDLEALNIHFEDVAISGNGTARVFDTRPVTVPNLQDYPAYALLGTASGKTKDPRMFTAILMTLIRLEKQKTDIVLTVNVPYKDLESIEAEQSVCAPELAGGGGGESGPMLKWAEAVMQELMNKFTIEDWGLFRDEDENENENEDGDIEMATEPA